MSRFLLAIVYVLSLCTALTGSAQNTLRVHVRDLAGEPSAFASVAITGTSIGTTTDLDGYSELLIPEELVSGEETLDISVRSVGFEPLDTTFSALPVDTVQLTLKPVARLLEEVVVTGTLSPSLRSESPVPVEVYTRKFLLQNPTPTLFAALERVNGVRPQLNCAVCNTGDIHINGLEGPYTMVTIDGMPIVSGLATVYGLQGIPTALIERVEVVKGPAGSLYGSEAVGGLINVITRAPSRAPRLSVDVFTSSFGEVTADVGVRAGFALSSQAKIDVLTGIQTYYYDRPRDTNGDNFTDLVLAQRYSLFQKYAVRGGALDGLQVAARALSERRWGGELQYAPKYRGGTTYYGEAIDTRRLELLGQYDITSVPGLALSGSYTRHEQRSDYGDTPYNADQRIGFFQGTYGRKLGAHQLLLGTALRSTYYDDDSFATQNDAGNRADQALLPGVFVQDEWCMGRTRLLTGLRYDYDTRHGNIWTPRVALKVPAGEGANLRFNVGTGFRVVSLFTEEHAALSGARDVVIEGDIAPERSVSGNVNYTKSLFPTAQSSWRFEASAWATRFDNQILPDYLSDATQIRYANLTGHSLNAGASGEVNYTASQTSASLGVTLADTRVYENETVSRPLLTERWSGTWGVSHTMTSASASWLGSNTVEVNYTGTLYSPMLLPVQSELDQRAAESPWWSMQNIQLTLRTKGGLEVYGGVKNLLDFRPASDAIARSFDPFDQQVKFDASGQPLATADNPQALVFDPSYVYAPNTGRYFFLGLRYALR